MNQTATEMAAHYGLQIKGTWTNEDGSKDAGGIALRIGHGSGGRVRFALFAKAIGLNPTATVDGASYLWARFDKAAFEAVSVELPDLTFGKSANAAKEPTAPAKPSFLSVVGDEEDEEEGEDEDEDPAEEDEDGQGGN